MVRAALLAAMWWGLHAFVVEASKPDPWWKLHFRIESLEGGAQGDVAIMVKPDWAPIGAKRFAELVHDGFYLQSGIFRVVDGFVTQFGINPSPYTNELWRAQPIEDDKNAVASNTRGRLSFATSGPGSRTTQVFFNTANNSFLDSQGFSPFAEVVEGMDVVDKIYKGYGEGFPYGQGPDQAKIYGEGNIYLNKNFPLVSIISEQWFDTEIPGFPETKRP